MDITVICLRHSDGQVGHLYSHGDNVQESLSNAREWLTYWGLGYTLIAAVDDEGRCVWHNPAPKLRRKKR